VRKKGWVLTSEAPAREPMRRSSSLIRSLRMRDLQRLGNGKLGVGGVHGCQWGKEKGLTVIFAARQSVQGRERRRGGCWQRFGCGFCL